MSDYKITFNSFCWDKQCPEYIEWEVEVPNGYGDPQVYTATSCQKVGQSYDIDEYPEDCLFLNDIQKFEKEREQMKIWEKLTPWKKAETF